ncbi:MAG: 5-formyltetrahydrofolate cyclo-ligase [Betaproteobacteria bacterium]
MPAINSLSEAKKALRATVLAVRDAMPPAARQRAGDAIMQRLYGLDVYRDAKSVLTYMSIGAEVDTHGFFDRLRADAKIAVLPRIDKALKLLTLHRVEGHADLVDGIWGIREPRADAPRMAITDLDMVLMPGLAFDFTGNRLGYGAGYYDRLLAPAPVKATRRPVRVAAAFDCQVVDAVPAGPADQPFHFLVTETRLLRISR